MSSAAPFSVQVHPSGPLGGYIQTPPSKNYSTRLILGAALAEGDSKILRPAANDDARALIHCLRDLGASIEEVGADLHIRGFAACPRTPVAPLNPGNAGAVLRLLLGTACLCVGEVFFVTDHADSLGRRPNLDLLDALRQLGAEAEGAGPLATLPIRIAGGPARIRGRNVVINGRNSSQYLSSLLYLAPFLDGNTSIRLADAPPGKLRLVSRPLIDQTLDALGHFGIALSANFDLGTFMVPGCQSAQPAHLHVNGDWPSAAALMAAVAVAGGMATLYGLARDAQGERRAHDALAAMGCEFSHPRPGETIIHSKGQLRAIDFNGDLATDAVLALVAAACVARGTSRFTGIANLKLKECDRIREPLGELDKIGVVSRHGDDWIEIDGNPDGYTGGLTVDSRGDHRVAQLLAIVGMRCARGLAIARAEHIAKSYPQFFEDLQRLGAKLDLIPA